MPRKKKYPNYNPEQVLQDMLETVSDLYESGYSLRKIEDELGLDQQKVRKLLCTSNYRGMVKYYSETAEKVQDYYKHNKTVSEIMTLTGLCRSSVHSYLPYTKVPYKGEDISVNARNVRRFREREEAVEELKDDPEKLWDTIKIFQGFPFRTAKGLKFSYKVRGGEMVVNRKEKTITRSTVETAYQKTMELGGEVSGPKELGTFGASYLYPIFIRLGLIKENERGFCMD